MQCPEARELLQQGVAPGSADALRTVLGFHLAACSTCREYRAQLLLQSLLDRPTLSAALAVRQPPSRTRRPTAQYQRGIGAALLVAGALAAVPLSQNATAQTAPRAIPDRVLAHYVPLTGLPPSKVSSGDSSETAPVGRWQTFAPAVSNMNAGGAPRNSVTSSRATMPRSGEDEALLSLRNLLAAPVERMPANRIESESLSWAAFAPSNAVDVARSQIIAFEKAGPQALPPQVLDQVIDEAFANLPLEAGQTLILPDDPVVPEPPPPVVAIPADQLPPLPQQPMPRPTAQPRPTPRPTQGSPGPSKPRPAPLPATRQYVVQAGDTLSSIALRYYDNEARWPDIYRANRALIGSNPDLIYPSQRLVIPTLSSGGSASPNQPAPSQRIYAVKSGDTLSAIALQYYGDANLWPLIYGANRGTIGGNPNLILPRQQLAIPQRSQPTPQKPTPTPQKPTPTPQRGSYVVKRGDSLRGIAQSAYGNEARWQEIYRANKALIPDPDRLRIGITLVIP